VSAGDLESRALMLSDTRAQVAAFKQAVWALLANESVEPAR
jgi:hypothetical protein